MDSNALIRNRVRVREWKAKLEYRALMARLATKHYLKHSLRELYIRNFAWIGSVEPCTGALCETCQRCLRDIVILKLRTGTHHATASSMLAAVEIGCRICTSLWREYHSEEASNHGYSEPFSSVFFHNRTPSSCLFDVQSKRGLEWYLTPSAMQDEMLPRIDLFSYQNDRNNLMNQYWKLAKDWLSECSSHHSRCKHVISVENFCPTRLIDVRANSSEYELRLYSTRDGPIKEPYMTLSHCWGKARFLRLTSLTHDRLQQGFALAELPPTFQDAIMVVRGLGINFLWIDSLCIIQGDTADWQRESALMSQVYSNSLCNIAALDAHDSSEGLFFDRKTTKNPHCTFTSCQKFRRKRVYEFVYADFWFDSVRRAPLTPRGWVFQERLLAPRVLYFGKRQLLWECNELRACEFYPRGLLARESIFSGGGNSDNFLKDSFTTLLLEGGLDNALTSSQLIEAWNDLVQHYTRCNLTNASDKLVAISGIAKRLQPVFKMDYLAGLWKDNLLPQLLWRRDSRIGEKRSLAGEKRPEYRAPSWSWASIDAPITPQLFGSDEGHIAIIKEASVTPVTDDITGQIKDGYIRLQSPLFPVKAETSRSGKVDLALDWGGLPTGSVINPDIWPQSKFERLQFVPFLISLTIGDMVGLILKSVEGEQGVYQRWGCVEIDGGYDYTMEWGRERHEKMVFSNFGVQQINGEWTYNPPEKYPEQIITLI